jgi:hypothetical protein
LQINQYDEAVAFADPNQIIRRCKMSYCNKEYILRPKEAYRLIKNCQGCGCKSTFINTGNYRVNANGNRVDVWLIYQCEECKHTYNLTIHERVRPSELSGEDYERYLANDRELAMQHGMDKNILAKNKVEIDWEHISCELEVLREEAQQSCNIVIQNPYNLKLRMDKLLSELLPMNRSAIKKLMKQEAIEVVTDQVQRTITVVMKEDML